MLQFYRETPLYKNRVLLILLLSLPKLRLKEGTQLLFSASVCLFSWAYLVSEANAQIVPDTTLPVNSIVTPQGNTNVIDGGTRAGSNLFHSFQEFSVTNGTEAFFNNGFDVQNIFSRVTGRSISNINGLIRANGTANLFLLNPNGIIFGPNAKLSIGGSFLASTANSFKFADGIEFSATNPQPTSLLTINVPIGLQYGANPGEIRVQGKGQTTGFATTRFDSSLNPLEVLPGKSLTIVGGNVFLDGGILQAPGGRVEIGAVGGEGTVGLNSDGSLTFSDSSTGETPIPRADVFILNKSGINVLAAGGGSISITSRNLELSGGSLLTAGIAQGEGTVDSIAGDIQLNISAATTIQSSQIENILNPSAIGKSGDIKINTGSLSATENAQLDTSTYGQGNAGSITLAANDFVSFTKRATVDASTFGIGNAGQVNIKGSTVSFDGEKTAAFSSVTGQAVGNAGGIDIKAQSLFVTNGALLGTTTVGEGNAGLISIESDTVSFSGGGSGAISNVGATENRVGVGDAGGIFIKATSLSVTDGAVLTTNTFGIGNAGTIIIDSDTVSFDKGSFAYSNVGSANDPIGEGDAGGISITAKSLSVTNGSQLRTSTFSKGDAGIILINSEKVSFDGISSGAYSTIESQGEGEGVGISITAKSLSVTNGAQLAASTFGVGNAGQILIESDTISFDGDGQVGDRSFGSGAFSNVEPNAVGNAGGISILAKSLLVTNGAQIAAGTFGVGNAGEIIIEGETVIFDGEGAFRSGAFSNVEEFGQGNAGGVNITAKSLSVTNGATLTASTFGMGKAGEITIEGETITFDGQGTFRSGAFSNVEEFGQGDAGGVFIKSQNLSVTNGARLTASTSGIGKAGQIVIESNNISFDAQGISSSGAFSNVEKFGQGDAGGIFIKSQNLSVTNGAALAASTFGVGKAGQVIIESDFVSFDGQTNDGKFSSAAFSSVAESGQGDAGGIFIKANSLYLTNGAQLTASTFGIGKAGEIVVESEIVSFDGQGTFRSGAFSNVEQQGVGNAGGIDITAKSLSVTRGARLSASTSGIGDAGQVTINSETVSFDGNNSGAFSNVNQNARGKAGGIDITAKSLSVTNGARLSASTSGIGNAGQITINSDSVSFDGDSYAFSNVEATGQGNAGGIEITGQFLSLTNGGGLTASTFGEGNAGEVIINSGIVSFEGTGAFPSGIFSTVAKDGQGDAGGIEITAKSVSVTKGAGLTASTFGVGDAGQVTIKSDSVFFQDIGSGAFSDVNENAQGDAGGIFITAKTLSVTNGAALTTNTEGIGNAGKIIIDSDRILFDGNSYALSNVIFGARGNAGGISIKSRSLSLTNGAQLTASTFGEGDAGKIIIDSDTVSFDGLGDLSSGVYSSVEDKGIGNAGGIFIKANSLSLTNGAGLSTRSVGNGNKAGEIEVKANSIRLSDRSIIFSDTEGGEGNINLQADSLILRRNSSITTNSQGLNNIGGNITISTDVLAALENSTIQANSEDFRGGRVVISTQGIFFSADSEISATGAGGNPELSGTVEIFTPNVDPSAGLVNLPENVVDSTSLIASSCRRSNDESSTFVITGRGGLPASPNELLLNEATWVDLRPVEQKSRNVQAQSIPNIEREENNKLATTQQIVEAQGWLVNGKGEVVLVAQTPTVTPANSKFSIQYCHDP